MNLFEFYFSPRGRISLGQWWLFCVLPPMLLAVLIFFIALQFRMNLGRLEETQLPFFINLPLSLLSMWVGLATSIKRWHDRGKSGWWVLIVLIPILGWIWAFIQLYLLPGDDFDNHY